MKKFVLIIIFFFLLGAICSLLPLSVHFVIGDSKSTHSVKESKNQSSSDALEITPIPTSVALGVVEKLNQVAQLSDSLSFPVPNPPKEIAKDHSFKKSLDEKTRTLDHYQMHTPTYLSNFLHPDVSCNETEIVGQIFDKQGQPIPDLVVVAQKTNGETKEEHIGYSGTFEELGPAGYQIKIPYSESTQIINIQLFSKSGETASERYTINVFPSCEKNFIVVNFSYDDQNIHIFFPLISH